MMRNSAALLFLVVCGALTCGGSGKTNAPITPEGIPALLDTIDPAKRETLNVPERLVVQGRPVAMAMQAEIKSPKLMHRWAAAYYFSRVALAEDIPRLVEGLTDENESIRTVFAATLLRLGDQRGLTIVQQALKSTGGLIYMEPPVRLADYANRTLKALMLPAMAPALPPRRPVDRLPRPLSLPKGHPLDVGVTIDEGCFMTVTLNLQFFGAGATQALIDVWTAAIKKMWNGQTTHNCCTLRVVVNTKLAGAVDPKYAQVDVVHVPPGGNHRSEMTLGGSALQDDISGSWDDTDTDGSVAAHECGHAMGIDDEYVDTDHGSVPAGPAVGEPIPSIMAQTWSNPEGIAPVGKERHAITIAMKYGAMCPESCIDTWEARRGTGGSGAGVGGSGGGGSGGGGSGGGGSGGGVDAGPMDAAPAGPAFAVSPIAAVFTQATFSTAYDVMIGNPRGEPLVVEWSMPSCGTYSPMGPQPPSTLELVSAGMVWMHPHPPCDPTTGHATEVIRMTVTGPSGKFTCTYQGAETGRGMPCTAGP
jgi:uncharacterized membrane protein YgcG